MFPPTIISGSFMEASSVNFFLLIHDDGIPHLPKFSSKPVWLLLLDFDDQLCLILLFVLSFHKFITVCTFCYYFLCQCESWVCFCLLLFYLVFFFYCRFHVKNFWGYWWHGLNSWRKFLEFPHLPPPVTIFLYFFFEFVVKNFTTVTYC